MYRMQSDINN